MKEKILNKLKLQLFYTEDGYGKFEKVLSELLDEYANWKIKECLPEKVKDLYFNALKYPKEAVGNNQAFGFNYCIDQILSNKDKIK